MKETVKLKINGRVQGVGFRYWVKVQAQKLKINGYAKNLEDGSVEILASGNKAKIKELEKICNQGPSNAFIKSVNLQTTNYIIFEGFKIF